MTAILAVCLALGCNQPEEGLTVYTSTRHVRSVAVADEGIAVGTTGGLLVRDHAGALRKYTQLDGLPSNEVVSVVPSSRGWIAKTPRGAVFVNGKTLIKADLPEAPMSWRGKAVKWSATELIWGGKHFQLPEGSHVSGAAVAGDRLFIGVYGSGLWTFDGTAMAPWTVALPAKDITAVAASPEQVVIGTRSSGAHVWNGGTWERIQFSSEIPAHNVQSFAWQGDDLLVSTLDEGLLRLSGGEWHAVEGISSEAPRDIVGFEAKLYVRHGTGAIDALGSGQKPTPIHPSLPRKQASFITAYDALYVGQWGGWSEFKRGEWSHFLSIPELQGLPITCIEPRQGLWIGTQRRGAATYDRNTGELAWRNQGLTDDWITCMRLIDGRVVAGTFVGGMCIWEGDRWHPVKGLEGENVTAIDSSSSGAVAATRTGLWRVDLHAKIATRVMPEIQEVQALSITRDEAWIGTRTGLWRVPTGLLFGP